MPRIMCPTCASELQVDDDALGEQVRCGSCQAVFVARAGDAPRPPVPPVPSRRRVDDEDEDRPARSASRSNRRDRSDDNDEDEDARRSSRRRSRRRDDEDDDYEPRRRRPSGNENGLAIGSLIAGVVALVLSFLSLLCCVGYLSFPISLVAIVLGVMGMKPGGKGFATGGIVTGVLAILVSIAMIAVVGAILAFAPRNNVNNNPAFGPQPPNFGPQPVRNPNFPRR